MRVEKMRPKPWSARQQTQVEKEEGTGRQDAVEKQPKLRKRSEAKALLVRDKKYLSIQALRRLASGPTITPCGAEPFPSRIRSSRPFWDRGDQARRCVDQCTRPCRPARAPRHVDGLLPEQENTSPQQHRPEGTV